MTGKRYLITYSDGGLGMRHHEKPLEVRDGTRGLKEPLPGNERRAATVRRRFRPRLGGTGHGRTTVYRLSVSASTVRVGRGGGAESDRSARRCYTARPIAVRA